MPTASVGQRVGGHSCEGSRPLAPRWRLGALDLQRLTGLTPLPRGSRRRDPSRCRDWVQGRAILLEGDPTARVYRRLRPCRGIRTTWCIPSVESEPEDVFACTARRLGPRSRTMEPCTWLRGGKNGKYRTVRNLRVWANCRWLHIFNCFSVAQDSPKGSTIETTI